MSIYKRTEEHMLAKQLTIASWCPSTPLSVGHAGYSAGSFLGVPSVTDVVHCGSNSCTRDTSLTICRSIRDRTTADSCREDRRYSFSCSYNASTCNSMQTKIMQANPHVIHNIQNHTQMHVFKYMNHTHQHRHGAHEYMYLHVHTNYSGLYSKD